MSRTEKIAILFKRLCDRYDGAEVLGKKAAQKMFYFFEREGIDLNLRYGIHFYGPYSSKLDDEMDVLESEGYLSINTNGPTHIIEWGERDAENDSLSDKEKEIVEYVMQKFGHKSPLDLEALSTMDYIANSILQPGASDAEIMHKFQQIKGTKFTQNMTENALKELKELSLIA